MMSLEEIVALTQTLSPLEKVRLVEQVMATLETDLQTPLTPRRSLLGLFASLGVAPSTEEIDEARREAWANFPREDI